MARVPLFCKAPLLKVRELDFKPQWVFCKRARVVPVAVARGSTSPRVWFPFLGQGEIYQCHAGGPRPCHGR